MTHTVTFDVLHHYDPAYSGIIVPVELKVADREVRVPDTRLDTGATHCIFKREYGELLGVTVEKGIRKQFGTASGPFIGFGHEILLCALGFEVSAVVYFANFTYPRNVLGRQGWMQQMRLGIIDYDGTLLISRYDDQISI